MLGGLYSMTSRVLSYLLDGNSRRNVKAEIRHVGWLLEVQAAFLRTDVTS
jgi:hypothetical protein